MADGINSPCLQFEKPLLLFPPSPTSSYKIYNVFAIQWMTLNQVRPLHCTINRTACIPFPLSATADQYVWWLWALTMQEESVYG